MKRRVHADAPADILAASMNNGLDVLPIAPPVASTRPIVVICGLIFVTLVVWAVIWPWSGEGDAVSHYMLAQESIKFPKAAMSAFSRPLHKLLLVLPAQGGNLSARIFSAFVSVLCAWQTIRLAEDLKIPNSPLAALLLIFQPYAFGLASDTMTELPMALCIVIAIRLWLHERWLASILLASFLPLARPEGAFLLPVWGVLTLRNQRLGRPLFRFLYSALLIVGMLCWAVLSGWLSRDPWYIYHAWFWKPDSAETVGHGPLLHYVTNWWEYCGPVLLVLFVAGMVCLVPLRVRRWIGRALSWIILRLSSPASTWRMVLPLRVRRWLARALSWIVFQVRRAFVAAITRPMILPLTVWLLVFVLHSFMWWRGMFGSLGLLRWIVPTAPITALICLIGFNTFASGLALVGLGFRACRAIAVSALGLAIIYAMAFYISGPSRYHGFALHRCAGYIRDNHLLDGAPAIFRGDNIIVAELNLLYDERLAAQWYDHDNQLNELLAMPRGAIGCWDDQQAAMWHCVEIEELEQRGFKVLSDDHRMVPNFWGRMRYGQSSFIPQRYVVLRKETPAAPPATQATTQPHGDKM